MVLVAFLSENEVYGIFFYQMILWFVDKSDFVLQKGF